jgi:hypothetical protein
MLEGIHVTAPQHLSHPTVASSIPLSVVSSIRLMMKLKIIILNSASGIGMGCNFLYNLYLGVFFNTNRTF